MRRRRARVWGKRGEAAAIFGRLGVRAQGRGGRGAGVPLGLELGLEADSARGMESGGDPAGGCGRRTMTRLERELSRPAEGARVGPEGELLGRQEDWCGVGPTQGWARETAGP